MNIKSFRDKSVTRSSQKNKFILKGKTVVYIDWANMHGWEITLKHEIDIERLFAYGYITLISVALNV